MHRLRAMTTVSRFLPLSRPAWWCALAVLLLNDHVLKGGGLVPALITGKLSDVAGLIVAPVLVVAVLRVHARAARAACFAAVVVPFVAIKLWPSAARAMEAAVALSGMRWRLWTDPTDLVAFFILPLAWRLCDPWPTSTGRSDSRILHGAAVALGAFACLATSSDDGNIRTSVFVMNTTREPIDLAVFRAELVPDCASLESDPEGFIASADFVTDGCRRAEPVARVPLDADWEDLDAPDAHVPPPGSKRVCDVVILRAKGLPDTAVAWSHVPKVDVTATNAAVDVDDPHALYLERAGGHLFMTGTSLVRVSAVSRELPALACGSGK